MRLFVMRHGLAMDRDDPSCPPDPERPLTAKGVIRTRRASRGLAILGAVPSLVLTSPYLRAVQTAEVAADELGLGAESMRETDALRPERGPGDIFAELADLPDDEVLLVGHAPSVDFIIARAVGATEPFTDLKKAGAACLDFSTGVEGLARLVWVAEPGLLRKLRA